MSTSEVRSGWPPAWTPARVRTRLARIARHETPFVMALQWLLNHTPFVPLKIDVLCFLQLDGVPDVPPSRLRGPGLVRGGTAEDIEGLVQCHDKRAIFLDRFAQGDRCVVAVVDERIVGYEWLSGNPTHFESSHGYLIEIPHGFVYAYDAYIDPAYRNCGFWLRFKAQQAAVMSELGKARVLTFVEYGNWPSLRAHLRFGFKPSRRVLALRILGMTVFNEQAMDIVSRVMP
jgi:hypothetical protein